MTSIPPMRPAAVELVRRLQQAGFEAYWVGGCVRDLLLGREPHDYDIATSATPVELETLFPHTVAVGRQFGVLVVLEAGHSFQVATFRAESDYEDGRHPTRVSPATARTDASRRDFTINGLFFDPVRQQLHDWVGGEGDLRHRLLRTIGDPQVRFTEDRLRLLRAVRLAAQFDLTVESATWVALQTHAAQLAQVSAERVREELTRLFRAPHAARGLELLRASGLLTGVLPEVAATVACEQSPDYHPEGTVYQHLLRMLERLPDNAAPELPWAVLLHDLGKPGTAAQDPRSGRIRFHGHEKVGEAIAREVLTRLRFPRKTVDEIATCVRLHMQFKDVPRMGLAALRRLLLRPTFPLELELHRLDCLGSHGRLDHYQFLIEQAAQLARQPTLRPPLLRGRDLQALGMPPGPAMGALLAEIREKQLQGELTSPAEASAWAQQRLAGSTPAHTEVSPP